MSGKFQKDYYSCTGDGLEDTKTSNRQVITMVQAGDDGLSNSRDTGWKERAEIGTEKVHSQCQASHNLN